MAKKRNFFNEEAIVIPEDDDEDFLLTPFKAKKKHKKAKASKDAPYQATNQKDVKVKSLPPRQHEVRPSPSGVVILENIGSNASNTDDQKVQLYFNLFISFLNVSLPNNFFLSAG